MKISRKKTSSGFCSFVLAALLNIPVIEVHAEANATPVPFPKKSSTITETELQTNLKNLEGFMTHTDHYIVNVHAATENYRKYVENVKQMLSRCEIESDISGFENSGFENLVAGGGRQCKEWVEDFNHNAMAYAARLDEAFAFQKLVQRVGERVQGQIDRIRIAMQTIRIKRAVDQGMSKLDNTRKAFKPWMGSKLNNR